MPKGMGMAGMSSNMTGRASVNVGSMGLGGLT